MGYLVVASVGAALAFTAFVLAHLGGRRLVAHWGGGPALRAVGGAAANHVVAAVLAVVALVLAPPIEVLPGATVAEVRSGSAAERAGIAVGDEVLSIDGEAVATPGDVVRLVGTHCDRAAHWSLARAGATIGIDVKADAGCHVGIMLDARRAAVPLGAGRLAVGALTLPVHDAIAPLLTLAQLLAPGPRAEFAGPVGITSHVALVAPEPQGRLVGGALLAFAPRSIWVGAVGLLFGLLFASPRRRSR